ncbi:MAG: glycosyl transferase group 1 [Chloroflexi bacterium]|nr:glycosyl transferase group 1 [Chloroflexota bacterium]
MSPERASPRPSALSTQDSALRVALVAPFGLRPKGTTIARVLPIARVLADQGAIVRVIVPPWDDRSRAGSRTSEGLVEIVHTHAPRSLLGPPAIVWSLFQEVRRFRPDVIHAFKPIGYSGLVSALIAARSRSGRSPLVIVDADDLEGPSGWAGRGRAGLGAIARGAQEQYTLRKVPRVTVASRWLQSYAQRLRPNDGQILYLPNGHSESGTVPVTAPIEGPASLVWYTRFTEAAPVRAAALLSRILADQPSSTRLTIIGDEIRIGDSDRLVDALADAKIIQRVDWLGYEPGRIEQHVAERSGRLVAIYPLDDDRVNRARCPSKIPQLMALGIPFVAEAVGEAATYLAGFESECLALPGDAEGFAARARSLLNDDALRSEVSARIQQADDRWRWEATASGLVAWYEEGVRLQVTRDSGGDVSP